MAQITTFRTLVIAVVVAASLLMVLLGPAQAQSNTITVNTTEDELNSDGDCSLREAITAANTEAASDACPAGSGEDAITFGVSGTVVLGSMLPEITDPEGLAIDGGDQDPTISGGGEVRVLQVSEGASLALRNLTVADGHVRGGDGGGVSNAGTLAMEGSTFSKNSSVEGTGGGIANGGTLMVTDSTFSKNRAKTRGDAGYGGGIVNFFNGKLTVEDSTFSRNSANTNFIGGGGGIANFGSSATTVKDSAFSRNSGTGIANFGPLTVEKSTFSNNSAGGGGGGIETRGPLTVEKSTFSGNIAGGPGGGIASLANFGDGHTLTVTDSTFSNNSARSGGGIYNRIGGATITGSTFSENRADHSGPGGGIHSEGPLTVKNDTFFENSAGGSGGGIATNGIGGVAFGVAITNATFSENSAQEGGGIANGHNSATFLRATIVANSPQGGNCSDDASDGDFHTISDEGYNIDDGTTCRFRKANKSQPSTDPLLRPKGLQDNGGPTKTIGLQRGQSPAIDAVAQDACPPPETDQRGVSRPRDGDGDGTPRCDAGAFELKAPTAVQEERRVGTRGNYPGQAGEDG
jgi:CSLREA domain-containing protein